MPTPAPRGTGDLSLGRQGRDVAVKRFLYHFLGATSGLRDFRIRTPAQAHSKALCCVEFNGAVCICLMEWKMAGMVVLFGCFGVIRFMLCPEAVNVAFRLKCMT